MRVRELYRFVESSLITTQTSSDSDVVFNDELYIAHPLGRTQAEQKNELSRASIDISMSLDNPLAQRHLGSSVDDVVTLTIFQMTDEDTYTFWKGRLSTVKVPSNKQVALTFESIFTSMRRPGLRGRYQKSCRHALYGRGCWVDPEDHAVEGEISAISGTVITIPGLSAYPDGRFRGGMIQAPDGVVRFITNHVGDVITLSRPFQTLINLFAINGPGEVTVRVFPGCAHNMSDCISIFDNIKNYGGFPWIPQINPMGGSSIV